MRLTTARTTVAGRQVIVCVHGVRRRERCTVNRHGVVELIVNGCRPLVAPTCHGMITLVLGP